MAPPSSPRHRANGGGGGGGGGGAALARAPSRAVALGAALLAAALALALAVSARSSNGGGERQPSLRQQLFFSGGSSSSSARGARGLCKHDLRLTNWDGRLIPACDPLLCDASPPLPEQPAPAAALPQSPARRWSDAQETAYLAAAADGGRIEGWLYPQQVAYLKSFSAYQHEIGVYGTVAEIGVHHGKLFAPLVGYSHPSERALALDLFEGQQQENVDAAGSGSQLAVVRTLTEITGIPRDQYTLVPGNSLRLSARNFSALNAPAFRVFSVDGGHSLETVLHDFNVAACGLRQGGIIILDDWLNGPWIGATEAIVFIAHAYTDLVPFFHGHNKLWFTTRSHARLYRAHADKHFSCMKFHASRAALAGFEMCLPEK
jgi:hypothetical protein